MTTNRVMLDSAFGLTLAGGVLVLAGGLASAMMTTWGGMWGPGHMMSDAYAPMGWSAGMGVWVAAWSLVSGLTILTAAVRMRRDAADAHAWGVLAMIGGALSYLAMGGFLLGGVAAIAGGALAVTAGSAGPERGPRGHHGH